VQLPFRLQDDVDRPVHHEQGDGRYPDQQGIRVQQAKKRAGKLALGVQRHPQMMLPKATPNSRLQPRLATEKLTSHICRHQRIGCLLRNSMATARKISMQRSNMNAR